MSLFKPGGTRRPLEERFWEKVNKNGPIMPGMKTQCWIWLACVDGCGYGMIGLGNRKVGKANRVSWELHFDTLGPGECALHRCDNPGCVRPDHLFKGTQKANALDREKKGRGNHPSGDAHPARRRPDYLARGEKHGNAALTNAQAQEIRQAYTGSYGEQIALAKKYGVCRDTIRKVVQGKVYSSGDQS